MANILFGLCMVDKFLVGIVGVDSDHQLHMCGLEYMEKSNLTILHQPLYAEHKIQVAL
jgi:hypothetical protein